MADDYIQVAPDSTGKKVDNTKLTVGANDVYRQRTQTAGAGAAELQDVRNTAPGASDYGAVTRIGDGHNVALGATADAAAAADGSNVSLVALFKRLLGRVTTLITNVATAAKQDTGNTSLASIDSKLSGALSVTGSTVAAAVSGTVTANAGVNLNTSALALEGGGNLALIKAKTDNLDAASSTLAKATTQTDGTQKAIARGAAKGTTTAADVTSTASGANHQGADVVLYDASGNVIDPRLIRAIASGTDSITVVQGTAAAASGGWPVKPTDGTNTITVKAASTAAAATDTSEVVQISPNQPQLTTPWNFQGAKTNNNAAPGATNLGVLAALANAGIQAWTEGNQVLCSVDLGGGLRTVQRTMVVLGAYRIAVMTGVYSALAAGSILFSARWGDATRAALVTRARLFVNTTTAATVAGMIDRDLVIVRSFSASDAGGNQIILTGNNNKLRSSHGTSLFTDMRIASTGALTPGTGTADGQALGLIGKQGAATEAVGLTIPPEDLFLYNVDSNYAGVLVQNEGVRVRIPTSMPTTIAQRTSVTLEWLELAAAANY